MAEAETRPHSHKPLTPTARAPKFPRRMLLRSVKPIAGVLTCQRLQSCWIHILNYHTMAVMRRKPSGAICMKRQYGRVPRLGIEVFGHDVCGPKITNPPPSPAQCGDTRYTCHRTCDTPGKISSLTVLAEDAKVQPGARRCNDPCHLSRNLGSPKNLSTKL